MPVDADVTTRDRLLDAAGEHLAERGIDGLTLRAIARRAGVSHGAPLRHFPGVAHLLAAVAAQGFRGLHASVSESVDELGPGADGRQALAAAARGYAAFALANPGAFELMFRHERHAAQDADLLDAGATAFLQLVGLVEAAQAEGWHEKDSPADIAAVVWATVHGIVSLWLPGTLGTAVGFTGGHADLDHLLGLAVEALIPPDGRPARRTTRRGNRP